MSAEGTLHSMTPHERSLALEVIGGAWERLSSGIQQAEGDGSVEPILGAVRAVAAALPERHPEVDAEYAAHAGEAAVWYLDRAVRRVGDPDRDGWTAGRRALNLGWFGSTASPEDLERLFAVATALSVEDE